MKKFVNCEMKAAHVTLRLSGGVAEYKVFGYAITRKDEDGIEYILLQPADCRCNPVMKVPKRNVASLEVSF